ncbi:hypothetical protein [Sorangium sp. So ce1335]|uniref:hypothetical protein n=1 Tax=Sorangium sp. So ce1335 TaxID=3133335 RepID=UPI003F5EC4A4
MTTKDQSQPKQDAVPSTGEPLRLSPELARELAREGLALRKEIRQRFAKMQVVTDEDLKLRTR